MKYLNNLVFAFLFAQATLNAQVRNNEPDDTGAVSIPEISLTVYRKTYTIDKYKISKDEKGNTTIIIFGSGFNVLTCIDGKCHIPVWCDFISGGKEISCVNATATPTSVTYFYQSSAIPETIVYWPFDDRNKKSRIDVHEAKIDNPNAQEKEDGPNDEGAVSIPRVSLTVYDNSYSIEKYKISKDEKGNTTITIFGNGFSVLPFRNGSIQIPVWVDFISGGKEIGSVSASSSPTSVTYFYQSSAIPETIVYWPSDDRNKKSRIVVQRNETQAVYEAKIDDPTKVIQMFLDSCRNGNNYKTLCIKNIDDKEIQKTISFYKEHTGSYLFGTIQGPREVQKEVYKGLKGKSADLPDNYYIYILSHSEHNLFAVVSHNSKENTYLIADFGIVKP